MDHCLFHRVSETLKGIQGALADDTLSVGTFNFFLKRKKLLLSNSSVKKNLNFFFNICGTLFKESYWRCQYAMSKK